jgi:hypothetical protein
MFKYSHSPSLTYSKPSFNSKSIAIQMGPFVNMCCRTLDILPVQLIANDEVMSCNFTRAICYGYQIFRLPLAFLWEGLAIPTRRHRSRNRHRAKGCCRGKRRRQPTVGLSERAANYAYDNRSCHSSEGTVALMRSRRLYCACSMMLCRCVVQASSSPSRKKSLLHAPQSREESDSGIKLSGLYYSCCHTYKCIAFA